MGWIVGSGGTMNYYAPIEQRVSPLEDALGGVGIQAGKYFGERADANEELLRRAALAKQQADIAAAENRQKSVLNDVGQREGTAAQIAAAGEHFTLPADERQRRESVLQSIEGGTPTAAPYSTVEEARQARSILDTYGQKGLEGLPMTGSVLSTTPSQGLSSPGQVQNTQDALALGGRRPPVQPIVAEIAANSRIKAAEIAASAKTDKTPRFADLVNKNVPRVAQVAAIRKEKGLIPKDFQYSGNDAALKAKLLTASIYQSDTRYPEANTLGKLADLVGGAKDAEGAAARLNVLLNDYAAHKSDKTYTEKHYPRETLQAMNQLKDRVKQPGWFAAFMGGDDYLTIAGQ